MNFFFTFVFLFKNPLILAISFLVFVLSLLHFISTASSRARARSLPKKPRTHPR
jgi:hypothetical protein